MPSGCCARLPISASAARRSRGAATRRNCSWPDADGIKIQLQDTRYGYGTGVLGDVIPPAPAAATKPVFAIKTLNHVTLTIANGPREKAFYDTVFGLPVRAMQGDGVTLAIGEGTDGIVFNPKVNNPKAVPGVNHVCFTMENFDAERVMATLVDNGFEPIETGIPGAGETLDVPGAVAPARQ